MDDGVPSRADNHHLAGMTLDLSDDEAAALTKHLRQALDEARYPLALRLDPLNANPREARSAKASAGTIATVKSRYGAKPRSRQA